MEKRGDYMTLGSLILVGLVITEISILRKVKKHSAQLKEHTNRINNIEELTPKKK